MARQRSASLLDAVWQLCGVKRTPPALTRSWILGLDSLETRALWAADLASFQLAAEPVVDSPQEAIQFMETDPASVPVAIGPGQNEIVAPPETGTTPVDPDPSQIPVVVGPGENIPTGSSDPPPTAIDIVAAMVGLLARESTVVQTPEDVSLPGIPVARIEQAAITSAIPVMIVRSRSATGTATPGTSAVADDRDAKGSLIDELLALDPATRNDRIRELEETLSRWPTDAKAADEGVTQWLGAVETDFMNLSVERSIAPERSAPGIHADENRPRLLPQIAALGIIAAAWSAPAAKKRSSENSRSDRERTPVDYYGTLVSADSFDGATIAIQVRDISSEGIGILHHGPLPGRRVTVIFGDGSWSQTRRGLVRWTRRLSDNVFASGVSFHEFR